MRVPPFDETATGHKRLKVGTAVRTTKDAGRDDWDPPRTKIRWGTTGNVIGHHDSHGLCYDVEHLDGTTACYDPDELRVIEGETEVADWTRGPSGSTNSSAEFEHLADEVGRIIRGSAHSIVCGQTAVVGRLIMAQLAHKWGLVPTKNVLEIEP